MENRSEGYIEAKRIEKERQDKLKDSLKTLFCKAESIVLEIGAGHGHFLTAYAEAKTEQRCLGIDLINKRVIKANNKKEKRQLEHLTFLKAEAGELLEAMPDTVQFHTVFILFPDPWPKKRHHKNRFIQKDALSKLAEHCPKGAQLCFRTDHNPYFEWTVEHIQAHPDWEACADRAWPFESGSYFQSLMTDYQSLIAIRA